MVNVIEPKKYVGYCGVYCGGCGMLRGRTIARVAESLRELIEVYKFVHWVPEHEPIDFNFKDFKAGIDYFSDSAKGPYCQVPCKEGGGNPFCEVRKCAENRGIEFCFQCTEFPCDKLSLILKEHPDLVKIKEIGIEKWVEEEEKKAQIGYDCHTRKYYTEAKMK